MRFLIKFIIFSAIFFALSNTCFANQTRIIVAPVTVQTVNSAAGIYPNISDVIANDTINELNKNLIIDALDLNYTDNLVMSHGLWGRYKKFLKDYKDKGVIDYKLCGLLYEKLGVQKILLVSSGFSMQSMVMKRSFLHKIGIGEGSPINSYYKLNVVVKMIDTQSCLVDFEQTFEEDFKVNNFEIPSNSLSDNIVSTEKIKKFSQEISVTASEEVFVNSSRSAYRNVRSNLLQSSGSFNPREGNLTRDGHLLPDNGTHLENVRKESFKNWIRERVSY